MREGSRGDAESEADAAEAARAYIASVIEINERRGMSTSVPESIYESAVRETERALRGMRAHRG